MGQLDELELGKSIGRIESKVDSIRSQLDSHDMHLDNIKNELAEKRGAAMVWGSVSGFGVVLVSKLIEHLPGLIR